jgi:hypothetical protein
MRNISTLSVALGAALLLGLAGASPSFAKGHNQSNTATPGADVGATTQASQQEGADQSAARQSENGKASPSSPTDTGKSDSAGR